MVKERPREEEEISTEEAFRCLGRFFSWMEGKISPSSDFREHMARSKVEWLKGVRSLIDKRIADLEKKQSKKPKRGVTRVKVE